MKSKDPDLDLHYSSIESTTTDRFFRWRARTLILLQAYVVWSRPSLFIYRIYHNRPVLQMKSNDPDPPTSKWVWSRPSLFICGIYHNSRFFKWRAKIWSSYKHMQYYLVIHLSSVHSLTSECSSDKEQRPWSPYKHMQSDPDLHYLPVEYTTSEDSLNEEQRPWSSYKPMQSDLDLQFPPVQSTTSEESSDKEQRSRSS